jgi:hypothetical protein
MSLGLPLSRAGAVAIAAPHMHRHTKTRAKELVSQDSLRERSTEQKYRADAEGSRGRVVYRAFDGLACGDRGEGNRKDGPRRLGVAVEPGPVERAVLRL